MGQRKKTEKAADSKKGGPARCRTLVTRSGAFKKFLCVCFPEWGLWTRILRQVAPPVTAVAMGLERYGSCS
jgi:hypothetical protein